MSKENKDIEKIEKTEEELKKEAREAEVKRKTSAFSMTTLDDCVITMRPPKGFDLRAVSHLSEGEQKLALIGNLCNLTQKEMDGMYLSDFQKLVEGLDRFLS